jgi:iron complex outermembrane recepter protein
MKIRFCFLKYFGLVLFFSPIVTHAETKLIDSTRTYNLGEVVVTADCDNITKTTTSNEINTSEIHLLNTSSVESVLSLVPGIHTTLSPKNEGQIFLRGFSQTQVALLMDGVPIYLPYDQLLDLDFLPVHSIEKITVSKSMPSVLYGPNAMGGVINIVTSQQTGKPTASASAQTGNTNAVSVSASGSLSQFYIDISGGYTKSDGFTMSGSAPSTILQSGSVRKNSQFEKRSAFIKAGFQRIANMDAALSFLVVDDVKGIPTSMFTSKPRYWRFTDWRKYITNLMLNTDVVNDLSIRGNLYYEKFNNTLDSYDDNTFTSQIKPFAFHSIYDDDTFGANISARAIGLLYGITKASMTFKNDRHAEMGNFNQSFKKYEIETYSLGLEQDFSMFSDYQIVIGVGNDWMRPVYANGLQLRPSTSLINGYYGMSKVISEDIKASVHVSRKGRFPAMKEFYSEILGRNAPNPNLKSEITLNTEIGCDILVWEKMNFRTVVFYNDVNDLIQSVLISSGVQQYQNIGTAVLKGAEISISYRTEQNQINANYAYLSSRNTTKGVVSTHLEYRPEHTLNIVYRHSWEIGLCVSAEMSTVSSFYGVDVDSRVQQKMSSYALFNIGITQEITSHYKIFCRVNNLTDKFYQADYAFPQPGREWIAGITASW